MAKPQPDRDADVVVQRLRVRYAKRGRLRFSSHRDFQRALERALRRAGVPVAFSGGFSPHPRVSYAGAAPTGTASEAEYLEVALAERREPEEVRRALDAALPAGLDVLEVVEAPPDAPSLPDLLAASVWEIALPGVDEAAASAAVRAFLAATDVPVERTTKRGRRRFDARAAVVGCAVSARPARTSAGPDDDCAIMQVIVRHGTPAVRPDDVLAGLRVVAGLQLPSAPQVRRLRQGPWDARSDEVADPLGGR